MEEIIIETGVDPDIILGKTQRQLGSLNIDDQESSSLIKKNEEKKSQSSQNQATGGGFFKGIVSTLIYKGKFLKFGAMFYHHMCRIHVCY